MSIYFFSLFPLCPINISSLSKNLIFQIQHKRHISIYTSIQEGFYYGKETLIFTQKLTNRKYIQKKELFVYVLTNKTMQYRQNKALRIIRIFEEEWLPHAVRHRRPVSRNSNLWSDSFHRNHILRHFPLFCCMFCHVSSHL